MPDLNPPADRDAPIPTEPFSAWLSGIREARRRKEGAEVPCGECRGCCTSAYFIPIAPDETDTLSHIPRELLFPAPGLPKGHLVLGYRENGHCPLFLDNRCAIYPHRPRTCRQYDCRVFPATGTAVEEGKPRIAAQAARWRFAFPSEQDARQHAAVRAAARFLDRHAEEFPGGFLPAHPSRRAMVALLASDLFLDGGDAREDGDGDAKAATRSRIDAVVAAAKAAGMAAAAGRRKGKPL